LQILGQLIARVPAHSPDIDPVRFNDYKDAIAYMNHFAYMVFSSCVIIVPE